MNAATLKTLLFLVAFGLFGGIGYVAYQNKTKPKWTYWDKEYARKVLNDVARPEAPKARIVSYDAVVKPVLMAFDWTGAPPRKVEEAAVVAEGPVVKPRVVVNELLTVLATQVDTGNPGGSVALVTWKNPQFQKGYGTLRIGMTLPAPHDGAVVKDIRGGGVEFAFTRDDQEPELVKVPKPGGSGLLVTVDPDGVRRPRPRSVISTRPPVDTAWPDTTRRIAADVYEIGSSELKTFGDDYARILTDDVRTETFYRDGKRAGLRLAEVKQGSIAAQHGAQSGDVIISINGQPVSSEQEAIKFVKNNSETTTVWQVVVENLGRQRTVTYNSPKKK